MEIVLVILIVLLILGGTAAGLQFLKKAQAEQEELVRIRNELLQELGEYRAYAASFERRSALVGRHASDYVNSLGSGASGTMMHIRRVLGAQESLCAALEKRISESEAEGLAELKKITSALSARARADGGSAEPASGSEVVDAVFQEYAISPEWEREFEEALQRVGGQVHQASVSYLKSMGMSERAKRRATYHDLREAGIEGIEDSAEESGEE